MAHTPGPWRFAQDGSEPYWYVDMPMQDGSTGYGFANAMVYTTVADARLIAAAPELLATLHIAADALDYAQAQVDSENDAHNLRVRLVQVKRVIAKAEGRAG
jgi:hypothetical protein